MSNLLKDHIDDPIKKSVVGMSLLGFKTYMSCCGFSYEGESVRKSHLGKCYIYLDYDQVMRDNRLLYLLSIVSLRSKWVFRNLYNFIDFYGETWNKDHPWASLGTVHNYEQFLITINALEKAIEELSLNFQDGALIEDGNLYYVRNVSKHWQYKPTEPWLVHKEDFYSL